MQADSWLQSVVSRRWPVLASSCHGARQMLARGSDQLSFEALANLTLADPLLLFDLLRLMAAQPALQSSGSMPAVEQMLMLLGSDGAARRFSTLHALQSSPGTLEPAVLEEVMAMLGRARVAAFIVKAWLSLAGEHKVEDCFVAAELYALPASLYLLDSNTLPNKPALQAVAEALGCDYPALLARFAKAAPLPEPLALLLGGGVPSRRRQLLKLAVATAEGVEQGAWRAPWQAGIEAAAQLIGVSYAEAYAAVVHAILQVARHAPVAPYGYAARRFLALEGEIPPHVLPQAAPQLDAAARIDLALREGLRHLANDLGFARVLFYRAHGHALHLKYQIGIRRGDALASLAPSLAPGSLLALLVSRPQSFMAPSHALAGLHAKYGDALLPALGAGDKAFLSLYAGGHPLGLFVADDGGAGAPIPPATYNRFKMLATRIACDGN